MNKKILSMFVALVMLATLLSGMTIVNAAEPVITIGEVAQANTTAFTVVDVPFYLNSFPDSSEHWSTLLFVFQIPENYGDINEIVIGSPAKRYDIDGYKDPYTLEQVPPGLVATPIGDWVVKKDELATNGKFEISIYDSGAENVAFTNASLTDNGGKLINVRVQLKADVSDKTININLLSATIKDTQSNAYQITNITNGKIIVGNGGEEPEPDTYKVTYNVDGDEALIVDDNEYEEDAEVTVTTQVPSREGYNFLGWSSTEGATTAEYVGGDTFTMGAENVTLYAVWEKEVVQYTVTFMADGEVVKEITVDEGGSVDPAQIPAVPAKAGFTGVWEEAVLTNITENITVNAVYTAVEGSAIAVGPATVKQGASTSVDITVNDIPETAKGIQYIVEYNAEAYDSIELDLSSKFDATYSEVDDDGEGQIAVIAVLNGDATLEDGDVVATINLRDKTDTEPGAYTIAIINPRYGDGGVFDATPIENVSNGTITVEAAEDPKLPAAEDAVKAFEDAVAALQAKALESLTAGDIADAEGLKTAAEAAVAELNADISEDAIVALTNRITAAYSELQAVEDKLEAFKNVNALAFDINDLNVLDVEVADAANINSYKLAVEVTQKRLDKEVLTVAEIQAAITEADAELVAIADGDSVLGNVNGSTSGTVDVNDVIMIKNYLLGDIPLTVAQAIRADMDKDGQLLATDTTNVLLKAIEDLRKSVAGV
ncbi:MAG: InlB B-repeat-containing protein [Eubacteriales bacterium]|nr:InlB B-repeat-containing protein [Eubacteriales bacterium]